MNKDYWIYQNLCDYLKVPCKKEKEDYLEHWENLITILKIQRITNMIPAIEGVPWDTKYK